jgi:hypothetical protein
LTVRACGALAVCRLLEALAAVEDLSHPDGKAPRLQGDLTATERTRTTAAAAAEVRHHSRRGPSEQDRT